MPLKKLLCVAAIVGAHGAIAGGAGWGALSGGLEALNQDLQRQAERDEQREMMERQHQMEMERIRLQHELQMRAIRAQQQPPQRAAPTAAQQVGVARVEAVHPGWQQLVRAPVFLEWFGQQPEFVKVMGYSRDPADLIQLINMFRDRSVQTR